ncbi:FemAB family XrtA/PEP-CTERM system-associated protein [Thalassotalea maritima]|uniref:FemAB family XrtA/PEP-CTERM system-associated protein n=1 Tax=Thalassotalea maritima TaxID=3242416 RepID=UPI0035292E21
MEIFSTTLLWEASDMMAEEIQTVTVNRATDADFEAWDCYVKSHQDSTFCHRFGWQTVLCNAFDHRNHSLIATRETEQGPKVVGVLPLFEVKSRLFAHALISSPFCVYGGAVADDHNVHILLEKSAIDLAEQLRVDYLELRYKQKTKSLLTEQSKHATFITEIVPEPEKNLQKIRKKQRAVVRHSLKNGLSLSSATIDQFYRLLSINFRDHGTPVMTKRYFYELVDAFSADIDLLTVEHDRKPITSVLSFIHQQQILPYYAGSDAECKQYKAMDFMYYQLMNRAAGKGLTEFDFGRSKNDSGAFRYKKNWGITPQPLHYCYHLVEATELPNLSPNNPKYQFFIKLWKRLPLGISQCFGPYLAKSLG